METLSTLLKEEATSLTSEEQGPLIVKFINDLLKEQIELSLDLALVQADQKGRDELIKEDIEDNLKQLPLLKD